MEKATIVQVGEFFEAGLLDERPALDHWITEGGDYPGVAPMSDRPLGGWTLDELREMARQAGTYHGLPPV